MDAGRAAGLEPAHPELLGAQRKHGALSHLLSPGASRRITRASTETRESTPTPTVLPRVARYAPSRPRWRQAGRDARIPDHGSCSDCSRLMAAGLDHVLTRHRRNPLTRENLATRPSRLPCRFAPLVSHLKPGHIWSLTFTVVRSWEFARSDFAGWGPFADHRDVSQSVSSESWRATSR